MTAPVDTNETTVRKSVTVNAPIDRAFEVFTARFDTWWPRTHHPGEGEMAEFVLESHVGGRWYSRGTDGRAGVRETRWPHCHWTSEATRAKRRKAQRN